MEVDLSVAVTVKLSEQGNHLFFRENATDGFKGLAKLVWQNGAITLNVEVFENALQGLAFVISPVSALANLLKNDVLKLLHARNRNSRLIGLKAPSLVDDVNEVGITLCGEHSI